MTDSSTNIEGSYYPQFHWGWGGCAEELFHYTSRYYVYTEAFLRNLAGNGRFSMSGYQARKLSPSLRSLLAAVLSTPPDERSASAVIRIIEAACQGLSEVDAGLFEAYRPQLEAIPRGATLVYHPRSGWPELTDISPLDPFLNMAERLNLPVAVTNHQVEVSLRALAEYLDSPVPQIRENLQIAVLKLHEAGYVLHNHPGLTHREADLLTRRKAC